MRHARGLIVGAILCAGCMSPSASNVPRAQPTGNPRPFWDNGVAKGNPRPAGPNVNIPNQGTRNDVRPASVDPDLSGVLAGQLVDAFNRRPSNAYIQVVAVSDTSARPIEVAADANGYFLIQGLQSGRPYLLTARATEGGRLLAGRIQASPPQPRLLIKLSEDLASGTVPPLPPPPGGSIPGGASPASAPSITPALGSPWTGSPDGNSGPAVAPDPPPRAGMIPPVRPESIAEGPADSPRPRDPVLNLPHLEAAPPTGNPGPNPQGTPLSSANVGPNVPVAMQVPSCRLVGNRLDNFALNDLDGRPWQFRYRHGRLVLLDFWGTWCRPCVAAIPHLINLQRTYGAYGLEVVGIACEHSQGPDAAQRIRQMQNRLGINYRLLLTDSGDRCPVQAQFRVDHYPTLVLLDSDGQLLWRAEGADRFAELETTIRHHLRR